MENKINSKFGIASFVLGIVGFCTAFLGGFGIMLDVLAIIFGIIAFALIKKTGRVWSQIAGISIAVVSIILYAAVLSGLNAISDEIQDIAEGPEIQITTPAPESNVDADSDLTTEPVEEDVVARVGDTINDGDIAIVVLSADEYVSENEFDSPKDGYYYLRVQVQAVNNSTDDVETVSSWSFSAYVDSESINEAFVLSDDKIFSGEIGPGKKLTGSVFYEIPIGAKEFELDYAPSFLSDKRIPVIVELNK